MSQYLGVSLTARGTLQLSTTPLGTGGEGSVYAVEHHAITGLPAAHTLVAKIYHDASEGNRQGKIAAMLKHPPASDSVAWPVAAVFTTDRQFAGYLMQKLDSSKYRQWSELANAADRRETSPHFDVQYALTAVKNLAVAIHSVHTAGHRLGDINESNIFVGTDATVFIVDTDSAQISHGDTLYHCLVGKPDYTAPELIGGSLRDKERTVATDMFAYAVAAYQMLTGGFHPTDGLYQGDDVPPDFGKKIRQGSFPSLYGANDLFAVNPKIPVQALPAPFVKVFQAALSHDPAERPNFRQVIQVSDHVLQHVTQCSDESNHWYMENLPECPWCSHAQQHNIDPWAVETPVMAAQQTALPAIPFQEEEQPVAARRAPIQRAPAPQPAAASMTPQNSSPAPAASPAPGQYTPSQQPHIAPQQPIPEPPTPEPDIPDKIKGKTVVRYGDGSWGPRPALGLLFKHNPKLAFHSIKNETPNFLRFWWGNNAKIPHPIGLVVGVLLHLALAFLWFPASEIVYAWLAEFTGWGFWTSLAEYLLPVLSIGSYSIVTILLLIMGISGGILLQKAKKAAGGSLDQYVKEAMPITMLRHTMITIFYGVPFILIGTTVLIVWTLWKLFTSIPTPASMR